ncbi:L-threonine kinase [Anaerospora hongkongensis]|uniref:L-threonine kinase n=1 Tax=Anaerospora hongkongensis TaxID=244830 RepID=A0A4V2Q885_9FIRM|nr:GHMP kinase [Anaerospora hongkongensis]TCL35088.1 L-threonine kinase [Anaerospora hongkongensis]
MAIKVKAPGSCGELVQGTIEGQNFLITCPIDVYSQAQIISSASTVLPEYQKAAAAMEMTLRYLGVTPQNDSILIQSELLIGKGMASSSADISAACQATALRYGKRLTADEIAAIALAIEPTDAIFYPGIMMFDHVAGKISKCLGNPPPIDIVILDVGGEIDTLSFNRRQDLTDRNQFKEQAVKQAVDLVAAGIKQGDSRLIGEGATISALANQSILYKPYLEQIIKIGKYYGAVGVNAAHSGTVLGVLFPAGCGEVQGPCMEQILTACEGNVQYIRTARLISGGLTLVEVDDE